MSLLKHWNPYQLAELGVAMTFAVTTDLRAALVALVSLIVADVLTGVAAAYKRGERIQSRRYFQGLVYKLSSAALIVPLWLFERHFGENGAPFSAWLAYILAFGELISIVENLDALGVPAAGKLLQKLKEAHDERLPKRD